ncbi:MAG: mercuric transport protein MerTP [Crocinitomicaceae bacterium]|nr:mercuric transport protein MerTP [Crocinitomicaceae bacterium]
MGTQRTQKAALGTGIVTAIASSLCCITPLLALISGGSGAATSLSWMEPFRPFLLGFTVLVLGLAWYQKLKPVPVQDNVDSCGCEVKKKSFMHSKKFLGIVTIFAVFMMAFPFYSSAFYPDNSQQTIVTDQQNIQKVEFKIKGMTCAGCEAHVKHAINALKGIISIEVSYKDGSAVVQFDTSKVAMKEIEKSINATGYTVVKTNKIES